MNYNPILILLLAAWMYSGVYVLDYIDRRADAPERGRDWLNLAALLAGPLVIAAFLLYDMWGQLRENFNSIFRKVNARRYDVEIELRDSRGQPVLDSGQHGESGEAILRLKHLLYEALSKRASDIFFDPKPNGTLVVRFRVDGALRVVEEMNINLGASVISAEVISVSVNTGPLKTCTGRNTTSIARVKQPVARAPQAPFFSRKEAILVWIFLPKMVQVTIPNMMPILITNMIAPAMEPLSAAARAPMDSYPAPVAAISAAISS